MLSILWSLKILHLKNIFCTTHMYKEYFLFMELLVFLCNCPISSLNNSFYISLSFPGDWPQQFCYITGFVSLNHITVRFLMIVMIVIHNSLHVPCSLFRLKAVRSEFPAGVCKIKCKADIAGGVWATSQSQVSFRKLSFRHF